MLVIKQLIFQFEFVYATNLKWMSDSRLLLKLDHYFQTIIWQKCETYFDIIKSNSASKEIEKINISYIKYPISLKEIQQFKLPK